MVREVARQYSSQVGFVEHDDMIEALSTDTSDQAFNVRILPRRSRSRDDFFDAHVFDAVAEVHAVYAVAVSDQKARRFVIRESFDELLVKSSTRGGEAIIDTFNGDDDYMVQVDVKLNSGSGADIWVRYTDSNNGYRIRLNGTTIRLHSVTDGKYTSLASTAYSTATSVAVKIKVNSGSVKAWVDGTLKINVLDTALAAGGVALAGDQPKFDNLKIGYDTNTDNDIDDAGDDLVVSETFGSPRLATICSAG